MSVPQMSPEHCLSQRAVPVERRILLLGQVSLPQATIARPRMVPERQSRFLKQLMVFVLLGVFSFKFKTRPVERLRFRIFQLLLLGT